MPELPDVEVFRRYMNRTALHQKIDNVEVSETRILKNTSASKLAGFLKNKSFSGTERYGKNLFVETGGEYLLRFHFGMTGYLKFLKDNSRELRHSRILFHFVNGYRLAFICQRLLGEVSLEKSLEDFVSDNKLGADALSINFEEFKDIIRSGRGSLKSFLMNQNKIAGLGNIYADEVLFQSSLHPGYNIKNLDEAAVNILFKNIKSVLKYAIKCKADPEKFDKSYLLPHRRKDGKCPRCDTTVKQVKVSGRTSYFCPKCQKKG